MMKLTCVHFCINSELPPVFKDSVNGKTGINVSETSGSGGFLFCAPPETQHGRRARKV